MISLKFNNHDNKPQLRLNLQPTFSFKPFIPVWSKQSSQQQKKGNKTTKNNQTHTCTHIWMLLLVFSDYTHQPPHAVCHKHRQDSLSELARRVVSLQLVDRRRQISILHHASVAAPSEPRVFQGLGGAQALSQPHKNNIASEQVAGNFAARVIGCVRAKLSAERRQSLAQGPGKGEPE